MKGESVNISTSATFQSGPAPLGNAAGFHRIPAAFPLRVLITAFLLLLLSGLPGRAQRTSEGMRQLSFSVGSTLSGVGGEAAFGMYLAGGYWLSELGVHNHRERDIPSGETLHFPRLTLRGGYMLRVLSDYSRRVCLYTGADAFLGLELFDAFHTLTPEVLKGFQSKGFGEVRFIYGAAPRIEAEWFVLRSTALVGRVRCPFTIGTPFPLISWEVGGGVKLNF